VNRTEPGFREDFLRPALRSLYAGTLEAIPGVLRLILDTTFAIVAIAGMALLHRASNTLLGEDATILGLIRVRRVFEAGHVAVLLEWARRQLAPWLPGSQASTLLPRRRRLRRRS